MFNLLYIPYNFLHSHYGYINIRIENDSIPLKTLLLTVSTSYEVMQVLKKYTESKIYLIIHSQIKQ